MSSDFRQISEDVDKRHYARALRRTNRLLESSQPSNRDRSRLLSFVADGEYKRGRFQQAAQVQIQAATYGVGDVRVWMRSYVGQVRAFLKVPNIGQALAMARHAVHLAEAKMADFETRVSQAKSGLREQNDVKTSELPPRVSVVATRMGYLFLQEGEPEIAEEFFEKAISTTKGGSCRARQGLAKIALAQGQPEKAMHASVNVIRYGKYRRKTLSAWEDVVTARRRMGGWRISDRLIRGLEDAPPSVRADATLLIVRTLRKNDMRQWMEVAEAWLESEAEAFPIVAAEIRKLLLASAKMNVADLDTRRQHADALLDVPELSALEWLSARKEQIQTALWAGESVDIQSILADAELNFGRGFVAQARHSLALSCMHAKRHDIARALLQQNIQKVMQTKSAWGKSVWALARMESLLGDHITSAGLYRKFFEHPSRSTRYRLQAQLLWCTELIESGDRAALGEAKALMETMLADISNPDILMNFARQLCIGPYEFQAFGRQLFERGKALALARYESAATPSSAVHILFKLTRRQVRDFAQYEEVTTFWEELDEDRRDWLWSEKNEFWEYLGDVLRAYMRQRKWEQAEIFAKSFIEDPAVPANGLPWLIIPYGECLFWTNRVNETMQLYRRVVENAPLHPLAAQAWYWLALDAYKLGDEAGTLEYARRIREAQHGRSGLLREWELDARAFLLLAGLNVSQVDPQAVNYSTADLQRQLKAIRMDLGRLSK